MVRLLASVSRAILTGSSNLEVYNVYMASEACDQRDVQSWSEWAASNDCNSSQPFTTTPYDTSDIALPQWAHQNLVNGQFDVNTAVERESNINLGS